MRYSSVSAAILAFTSSVFAQTANFAPMYVPTQNQNVAAGSVLDITWQPSTVHPGPITIQLLQGATPSTLELGVVVSAAQDQTTGKFAWTVPADLKSFATYGFKITLDSTASDASPVFQFSFPFHITGLGAASSSSATGGTTTVQLSTGASYAAVATSSSSSSASVMTYAPATTSAPAASVYVPAVTPAVYPMANTTIATTYKPSASAPGNASATYTPATVVANAGASNMAGGFAVLGGLALALAL